MSQSFVYCGGCLGSAQLSYDEIVGEEGRERGEKIFVIQKYGHGHGLKRHQGLQLEHVNLQGHSGPMQSHQ